ncbi:MAG: DUF6753 family protein [Cyanobacteria bacterium J06638_22]
MSSSSPIPLSHQSSPPLLDKVLHDLTPDQKARVLDLVVRLDLDPDDPLWLIAIAIGQLQILVEDAPNDWGHLFTAFLEELEQWKTHNLNTLDQLVLEAEAVQALSQHSKTLSSHINDLQTVLQLLIETLQTSMHNTQTWQDNFAILKRELLLSLGNLQVSNTPLTENPIPTTKQPMKSIASWIVSLLTLAVVLVSGISLMQLRQVQVQQGQHLQWLMEKENRRDCQEGTLPASSPLCH